MNQQESTRIRELERRVGQLTTFAVVQGVALVILLFRPGPLVAIGFIVLLPILAFATQRLPAFARACGRFFSFLSHPPVASAESSVPPESPPTI